MDVGYEEEKPCCECECEWYEWRDGYEYPYGSEKFKEKYKFFNGKPHICFGKHPEYLEIKDEKCGIIVCKYHTKNAKGVHICTGIWCPRDCCMDVEEFFRGRFEEEQRFQWMNGNNRHPVIPTPPPASREN